MYNTKNIYEISDVPNQLNYNRQAEIRKGNLFTSCKENFKLSRCSYKTEEKNFTAKIHKIIYKNAWNSIFRWFIKEPIRSIQFYMI